MYRFKYSTRKRADNMPIAEHIFDYDAIVDSYVHAASLISFVHCTASLRLSPMRMDHRRPKHMALAS